MPARSSSKKHKDINQPETSAGESQSRHWQSIRPWRPPEGLQSSTIDPAAHDHASVVPFSSSNLTSLALDPDSFRIQVEVIDVASTAVALAIFSVGSAFPVNHSQARSARRTTPSTGNGSGDPSTTSLTVKLNGSPWPNVLHSDPAFFHDSDAAAHHSDGTTHALSGATTVVIYGLDPGTSYQVELDWVREPESGEYTACLTCSACKTRPNSYLSQKQYHLAK